ncbi:RBBP9/YdeN family alpha/beta hydrolase [Branchiibius cervicis]|uniref:RBBP9/YdeN family alpha/beta hydrolase n=1 Tax=Branchiibius cervicis TaxID=908252 RepID=A0ABW2AXD5_9MICO
MIATNPQRRYRRVLIVHGFGASIDDHWFPWLADATPGAERIALPEATTPVAQTWISTVADAIGRLGPETAVIAHSLGCVTVAQAVRRVADSHDRLGLFVAVAPFAQALPTIGDPDLDAFIADGLDAFIDLDLASIQDLIERVEVVRSDNDPIVPPIASDQFAHAVGANVHVVPGAGHFLAREGIDQLDIAQDLLARP